MNNEFKMNVSSGRSTQLNHCINEFIFGTLFHVFWTLAHFTVICQFRVLKHLFHGPSFPTSVPVWGSIKRIPAVFDSPPLLLLLSVECLISLYSSCLVSELIPKLRFYFRTEQNRTEVYWFRRLASHHINTNI